MGEGTHALKEPHSRTETPNHQLDVAQRRSSVSVGQDATVNRLLNLLKEFNSDLKGYIGFCIDILSIQDAQASQSLTQEFVKYQAQIEQIESEFATNAPDIAQLEQIYHRLKALYQAINTHDGSFKAVTTDSDNIDVELVTRFIEENRKLHAIILKRLATTFDSYKRSQKRASIRQEMHTTSIIEGVQMPIPVSERVAHAKAKFDKKFRNEIADEQFERLMKGYRNAGSVSQQDSPAVPSENSQIPFNQVNDVLKDAMFLKSDITLLSDKLSKYEIIGCEIETIQNIVQIQYDRLAQYKQHLEECDSLPTVGLLSVPNLIHLFSNSIVSLYEAASKGIIIWQAHFEQNKPTLPEALESLGGLTQAVESMKSLWTTKEWETQSKDPTWGIQTLLSRIENLLLCQQRLVLKQTVFIDYIKEMALDARLVEAMRSIDAPFIDDDISEAQSISSRASFFGHSRNSSHTSYTSVGSAPSNQEQKDRLSVEFQP